MEKIVLVKYEDNWADEMDIAGFVIMTKQEWEDMSYQIRWCMTFPIEFSCGTNEFITYKEPGNFLQKIEVQEISYQESLFLKRIFPEVSSSCWSYGHFDFINDGALDEEFYLEKGGFIGREAADKIVKARHKQ